jgi:hypothetical protein
MLPFPSPLLLGASAAGVTPLTAYRYFKLNVDSVQSFTDTAICEWQMAASSGGSNLIQGKTATASSTNGPFTPNLAVDGTVASGNAWRSATGFPDWLKIDMGAGNGFSPAEMKIVVDGSGTGSSQAPKDFQLLGSNDDVTYTQLASWSGFTAWATQPAFTTFTISQALPVFSVSPAITTDTGFYGQSDTATVAYAHNGLSTAIQWLRDGVAIGGATAASYTYVLADVGTTVSCRVTATNGFGSTTQTATGHAIVTPTYSADTRVDTSGNIRVDTSGNTRVTNNRTA